MSETHVWLVAAALAICVFIVGCADTKHVGDSRTWQDKKTGDFGAGNGDEGISQWMRDHQ